MLQRTKTAVAFFSDANIIKSTVNGALANSPFGQFFAPGLAEGTHVDIVIRPQHVESILIEMGRALCLQFQWVFQLEFASCVLGSSEMKAWWNLEWISIIVYLRLRCPSVFLPKVGQPLWLTVPRDRCFVFPE